MSNGLRGYSTSFVRAVEEGCQSDLMAQFASACIARDLPVAQVAQRLGVSRPTVYAWFTGRSTPRARHQEAIKRLMARWIRA